MPDVPLLQVKDVTKSYDGVVVLEGAHLQINRGELRLLVGENGAGKSTLMKIVTGATMPDCGRIIWKGKDVRITNTRQAQQLGIQIVHQELNLVPQLSIVENIFLGRFPLTNRRLGWIDWREARARARQLLDSLRLAIDVDTLVGALSVAEQQLVEIAKAVAFDADLIILDEPTASLTGKEAAHLFRIISDLKSRGVAIVYISHRLSELRSLADSVTVMRDGRVIATMPIAETSVDQIIQLMVGRELREQFPERRVTDSSQKQEILRVEGLTSWGKFYDISFSIRSGEIVGIAGLVGSGRTDTARALFGADPYDRGKIFWRGKEVKINSPVDAIRLGMGLVTEDRKAQGLIGGASVVTNITLASGRQLTQALLSFDHKRAVEVSKRFVQLLNIKASSLDQQAQFLSGGNQQKVVLARWLCAETQLLIVDEPTRGIDVGAKAEIYRLIRDLAAQGVAIIMISSEMEEILGLSDRIIVMREGRIQGELSRAEATQERIMALATAMAAAQEA